MDRNDRNELEDSDLEEDSDQKPKIISKIAHSTVESLEIFRISPKTISKSTLLAVQLAQNTTVKINQK